MCDSDLECDMVDFDDLEEEEKVNPQEDEDPRDHGMKKEEEKKTQLSPESTPFVSTCNNDSKSATITLRYTATQKPHLSDSIRDVSKHIATECNTMISTIETLISAFTRLSTFEGINHAFLHTLVNFRNVLNLLVGMIKTLCGVEDVKAYALMSSSGKISDFCMNYQSAYYGKTKYIHHKEQYSAIEVSVTTNKVSQILDMATQLVDNIHLFSDMIDRFPTAHLEDDDTKQIIVYQKKLSHNAILQLKEHVQILDVYHTMKKVEM